MDNTALMSFSSLVATKSKGNQETMDALVWFLDYMATHTDAKVCFHRSDMILKNHSDTSYISKPKYRSRAGVIFISATKTTTKSYSKTGPSYPSAKQIKMSCPPHPRPNSQHYSKIKKEACPLQQPLYKMRHQQQSKSMQNNNSTSCGISTETIHKLYPKAIDMQFY